MEFSTLSAFPLATGLSREEYISILSDPRETVNQWNDMISGYIEVDGEERECVIGFESNAATSVSVVQLEKGDTFFDVSLNDVAARIRQNISATDKDSILTADYIALPDHRVVLYFVEEEACVIRWFDPKLYTPSEFICAI
ncbi:hypothetical protein [Corynebacterium kalidii]|uniref:Uncharacterized protein n=1 Tax=Corynebacterium kalidii TaxID=2931982 RepID=A0A9X2AYD9_9CORY|nr:hypothetical protein [Corynebacterium kalidii]MCJ7857457.1 hypothetical protein [Corynebacterium kalidii]